MGSVPPHHSTDNDRSRWPAAAGSPGALAAGSTVLLLVRRCCSRRRNRGAHISRVPWWCQPVPERPSTWSRPSSSFRCWSSCCTRQRPRAVATRRGRQTAILGQITPVILGWFGLACGPLHPQPDLRAWRWAVVSMLRCLYTPGPEVRRPLALAARAPGPLPEPLLVRQGESVHRHRLLLARAPAPGRPAAPVPGRNCPGGRFRPDRQAFTEAHRRGQARLLQLLPQGGPLALAGVGPYHRWLRKTPGQRLLEQRSSQTPVGLKGGAFRDPGRWAAGRVVRAVARPVQAESERRTAPPVATVPADGHLTMRRLAQRARGSGARHPPRARLGSGIRCQPGSRPPGAGRRAPGVPPWAATAVATPTGLG
jgi:hypothetical protein